MMRLEVLDDRVFLQHGEAFGLCQRVRRNIEVARAELAPAGPREYYRDDLLGFRVSTLAGVELGHVSHFLEAPAAAVMVVRGEREHWIPAAPPHLVKVQLEQGLIVVDWPEDL